MSPQQPHNPATGQGFLPNFCSLPMVLGIVVVGELVAIILTLSPIQPNQDRWTMLGQLSLFIQWLGLSSALLLCQLSRWLGHRSAKQLGLISYLLLVLNTLLFSEIAYQLIIHYHLLPQADSIDHGGFLFRCTAIGAIIYAVALRYHYLQYQLHQQQQAELEAKLAALQARIRPHFLFNTMNTIASLIHDAPQQAEQAIEDFSDLLRASLQNPKQLIPLEEELALCRGYLEIEQLRLGNRLSVNWRLAEADTACDIPPLSIQPLLENAVYHGIEPCSGGGTIEITSRLENRQMILQIRNPIAQQKAHRQGNRIALENIRQRLALAFGEGAKLTCTPEPDHYLVTITLPING